MTLRHFYGWQTGCGGSDVSLPVETLERRETRALRRGSHIAEAERLSGIGCFAATRYLTLQIEPVPLGLSAMVRHLLLFTTVIVLTTRVAVGQPYVTLAYSGKLLVKGQPFSGTAAFFFNIEDKVGSLLWASGEIPYVGYTNVPPRTLMVPVRDGLYDVKLGDTRLGMSPIDLAALGRLEAPRLKLWFNDGTNGWQRAGSQVELGNLVTSLWGAGERPMSAEQGGILLDNIRNLGVLVAGLYRDRPPESAPRPPRPVALALSSTRSLGSANAPVTMLEFTDYECVFCRKFNAEILPTLHKDYVATGKLRIVSCNLPLRAHLNAVPAARAALCADEQGKFWAMRELLFTTSDLSPTGILATAEQAALDLGRFRSCLASNRVDVTLRTDQMQAASIGIDGTPTFIIGRSGGDTFSGTMVVGAQSLETFERAIQNALVPNPPSPPPDRTVETGELVLPEK
jgi:protein-disulfide isomerase